MYVQVDYILCPIPSEIMFKKFIYSEIYVYFPMSRVKADELLQLTGTNVKFNAYDIFLERSTSVRPYNVIG